MQLPSAKPRSVNADGLHMPAYRALLPFLPTDLRLFAEETIASALELYECDRHFEVVAAVESVLSRCKQALTASPSSIEAAPAQEAVQPMVVMPGPDSPSSNAAASTSDSNTSVGSAPSAAATIPTALAVTIFYRFLETSVLYQFALSRTSACEDLTREIESDDGWKYVSDHGNGDGTYYRYDAANDAHFFKVRGTINVSILYVCSILMELDLYSEWFPNCNKSVSQGEVSRYCRSAYMLVSAPWPFSSRDVMMLGAGIDDLEARNRIVIVAHSIPFAGMAPRKVVGDSFPGTRSIHTPAGTAPPGVTVPVHNNSNVVCDIIYTGFEVKMRTPSETRLSFMLSVDPKVANIPQGVLNWLSGKVMWGMLGGMETAAKRAMRKDSKYYQRRRQRPDVYNLLRDRYNEMLKTKFSPEEYEKNFLKEDY